MTHTFEHDFNGKRTTFKRLSVVGILDIVGKAILQDRIDKAVAVGRGLEGADRISFLRDELAKLPDLIELEQLARTALTKREISTSTSVKIFAAAAGRSTEDIDLDYQAASAEECMRILMMIAGLEKKSHSPDVTSCD